MRFLTLITLIVSLYLAIVGVGGLPSTDISISHARSEFDALVSKNNTLVPLATDVSCHVSGVSASGTCLNSATTCCNGFYTRGFCLTQPNNVLCCTETQVCSDGSGFCNDVNHVSCSVGYVKNLCPGPASVQCCRGNSGASFCTAGGPS